jgi:FkbM family methyltransferase
MRLSRNRRAALGHLRRRFMESIGSERYSHVAIPEIEASLNPHLSPQGFYVEAGANDGIWQSNTYLLEKRGWTGILIEPIPELFHRCRRNRPRSDVINRALVSADHSEPTVQMMYAGLMSMVQGAQGTSEADDLHVSEGERTQGLSRYTVEVPTTTLTEVLAHAEAPEIDLFSLDVEGFELEVLKGLDFQEYCPRLILVEARTEHHASQIANYLRPTHELVEKVTMIDYLYQSIASMRER